MREIDMLAKEKEIKLFKAKQYLKTNEFAVYTSLLGLSTIPYFLDGVEYLLPAALFNTLIATNCLIESLKKNTNCHYELLQIIIESSDYKKLQIIYNVYISELASFLKKIGFKNSRELILYITRAMNKNMFSEEAYEYHKFKYGYDMTFDNLGVMVAKGKVVCRHTTSFITDVLREYGYTACTLSGAYVKEKKLKKHPNKIKSNHVINCVAEGNEKYAFDPTNLIFLREDEKYHEMISISKSDKQRYFLLGDSSILFNERKKDDLIKCLELPYAKKETGLIEPYNEELEEIKEIDKKLKELNSFVEQYKTFITRMAELVSRVSPMSDTKLKSWHLK